MAGRSRTNKLVDFEASVKISGKYEILDDVTSFKLPGVEYGEGEISGAGLAGTLNIPDVFNVGALEFTITSRALRAQYAKVITPSGAEFRIAWAMDKISSDSAEDYDRYMAIVKGKASKLPEISGEKGSPLELETAFSVWYYKLTVNGVTLFEFDILNGVVIINGVNYSAKLKTALGSA